MNAKQPPFTAGQVVRLNSGGQKNYQYDVCVGDKEAFAKPFFIIRIINACADVLCEDNKERCVWLHDIEAV